MMIYTEKEVILPETLELLRKLQRDPLLNDFFLVGGTGLALQIGHRLSIDLDLFTEQPFDTDQLEEYLANNFAFYTDYLSTNTLKGFIENVKVDFLTHAYPLVKPLLRPEGLRLASIEDIGAMKLNAIAHSGNRQKDFYDMFFILEQISIDDLLQAYNRKYPRSNPLIPIKALTWFEDIDFEIEKPRIGQFYGHHRGEHESGLAQAESPVPERGAAPGGTRTGGIPQRGPLATPDGRLEGRRSRH